MTAEWMPEPPEGHHWVLKDTPDPTLKRLELRRPETGWRRLLGGYSVVAAAPVEMAVTSPMTAGDQYRTAVRIAANKLRRQVLNRPTRRSVADEVNGA